MMTDSELEQKLQRLGSEVAPEPSVMDAVMDQIRRGSVAPPLSRRALPSRVLRSRFVRWFVPLAAAAAVVLAVIEFRPGPGGGHGGSGMVWADVLERVNRAKTMVFWASWPHGRDRYRFFMKDPGLERMERHYAASQPSGRWQRPPKLELDTVKISPALGTDWESVSWSPLRKSVSRVRSVGCPRGKPGSEVTAYWDSLRRIGADKARTVGKAELGGVRTVIFEAPIRDVIGPRPYELTGTVRVWVNEATGVPVQMESRCRMPQDAEEQVQLASDIQWDVPLSDDLFRMPRLDASWRVTDYTRMCFSKTRLKPGVTIRVGFRGEPPILTEADVERVDQGTLEVTTPGASERRTIAVTLTAAGSARMKEQTGLHVGGTLVLSFNGELENETPIRAPLSLGVQYDITALGKSLEQFEADYLTSQ